MSYLCTRTVRVCHEYTIIDAYQGNLSHVSFLRDVRAPLNLIKLLNGRDLFLKLRASTDIALLELSDTTVSRENKPYLESLYHLLEYAFKIDQIHSEVLINSSTCRNKLLRTQLENNYDITNFSIKISNFLETDKKCNLEITESNENWCSREREMKQTMNKLSRFVQTFRISTLHKQRKLLEVKMLKQISHIKLIYHIICGLISLHNIDYQASEEFRSLLGRVNQAQNLTLYSYKVGLTPTI